MPPKASSSTLPKSPSKKRAPKGAKKEEEDEPVNNASQEKLPLQAWLKLFTERSVDMRVAMILAGKLYSTTSSEAEILKLTGPKLQAAGINDKEQKKSVMSALRGMKISLGVVHGSIPQDGKRGGKKRKWDEDLGNPLLPDAPGTSIGKERARDYDFHENLDSEIIRMQTVTTNRAPCMTAWAYIILSQMGFNQLESLSLASVFTSVTSTQHALNLGNIYTAEQERDARLEMSQLPGKRRKSDEAGEGEGNSQPWVGVMRRRLPVIQLADKTWRGLSKGMAVEPEKAFSYITRNFKETTPYVIGALRLLAQCYTVDELNEDGYGMYVSFRPDVQGWGDRATLFCSNIIDLIPPEKEVDLALHKTIIPQPVKEELIQVKDEQPDEIEIQAVKEEMENDVKGMKKEEGGFEVGREDVFEGFWEAEYDDE